MQIKYIAFFFTLLLFPFACNAGQWQSADGKKYRVYLDTASLLENPQPLGFSDQRWFKPSSITIKAKCVSRNGSVGSKEYTDSGGVKLNGVDLNNKYNFLGDAGSGNRTIAATDGKPDQTIGFRVIFFLFTDLEAWARVCPKEFYEGGYSVETYAEIVTTTNRINTGKYWLTGSVITVKSGYGTPSISVENPSPVSSVIRPVSGSVYSSEQTIKLNISPAGLNSAETKTQFTSDISVISMGNVSPADGTVLQVKKNGSWVTEMPSKNNISDDSGWIIRLQYPSNVQPGRKLHNVLFSVNFN